MLQPVQGAPYNMGMRYREIMCGAGAWQRARPPHDTHRYGVEADLSTKDQNFVKDPKKAKVDCLRLLVLSHLNPNIQNEDTGVHSCAAPRCFLTNPKTGIFGDIKKKVGSAVSLSLLFGDAAVAVGRHQAEEGRQGRG